MPPDCALVAWVDTSVKAPNAADPDGAHWGMVLRSQGEPIWIDSPGTGRDKRWTDDDRQLASRLRDLLSQLPQPNLGDWRSIAARLRQQRLAPLANALGPQPGGLPQARKLIVLPSSELTGLPLEALLGDGEDMRIAYAPSATIWAYLRGLPRPASKGLLAVGDPIFNEPTPREEPGPPPSRGLLLLDVLPDGAAHRAGLKQGQVLLTYNNVPLHALDDLKTVAAAADSNQAIPIEVWREDGQTYKTTIASGRLGVAIDPQPAPIALRDQREFQKLMLAARSGSEFFPRLPGTRFEAETLRKLFVAADRPTSIFLDEDASEQMLERLASSKDINQYAYIHLATHAIVDQQIPARSAVILTQTGLPDPIQQIEANQSVFDGRLSTREIQRQWELNAELVTLSACETARGRDTIGEGMIGFSQSLLMSGTRCVCLSLWKVDDTATALLMGRFYANLLGKREGLGEPMIKRDALREAKIWLRTLPREDAGRLAASLTASEYRGTGRKLGQTLPLSLSAGSEVKTANVAESQEAKPTEKADAEHPYAHPYYWSAFILIGDAD